MGFNLTRLSYFTPHPSWHNGMSSCLKRTALLSFARRRVYVGFTVHSLASRSRVRPRHGALVARLLVERLEPRHISGVELEVEQRQVLREVRRAARLVSRSKQPVCMGCGAYDTSHVHAMARYAYTRITATRFKLHASRCTLHSALCAPPQ